MRKKGATSYASEYETRSLRSPQKCQIRLDLRSDIERHVKEKINLEKKVIIGMEH